MTAFVFGKLPAHGDFVARGLTAEAQARWDAWLSGELAAARAAHGAKFETRFDSAPVWRFADDGVAGAIAPSVDAVGRRFPLVAAATGGADPGAVAEACEERIYAALSEGWTADRLVASLVPGEGEDDGMARWWTPGSEQYPEAAMAGSHPGGLITAMLTPRGARA